MVIMEQMMLFYRGETMEQSIVQYGDYANWQNEMVSSVDEQDSRLEAVLANSCLLNAVLSVDEFVRDSGGKVPESKTVQLEPTVKNQLKSLLQSKNL